MQNAQSMKEYQAEIRESLDDRFLRETLDKFSIAYRANRAKSFEGLDEHGLIAKVAAAKNATLDNLESLYEQFSKVAASKGIQVHRAATAAEANAIICAIAKENNCQKIIKSKSMTAEEIHLNHAMEEEGYQVVETDLGERIIQLRHEGPSHMVMPAIHLSRQQVAELFTKTTGHPQEPEIARLTKVARRQLRARFIEADMGISGANFALADSATIGICTNEGNARLVTTLPRVHVALVGLDKLVAGVKEALSIVHILARNATGQAITSYVSWISGANECAVAPEHKKIMHVVFLDNGRSGLAKDSVCREALRCIRCGACANVCPVFRLIGGHKMGHVYIGAIGLILTYFYHGREKDRFLVQNCINCGACKSVCAAGIDLPALIQEVRARLNEEEGAPIESSLIGKVMGNRRLFHSLLRLGSLMQKPLETRQGTIRHLPQFFRQLGQDFRTLPALADHSFRSIWKKNQPQWQNSKGRLKVGLFTGCAVDFIYPEQMSAAAKLLSTRDCALDFPEGQNCCGLPLQMMGERKAAEKVALDNLQAFDPARFDYIITLCASCASHIKHAYPRIFAATHPERLAEAEQFCQRIKDFSSFACDVLGLEAKDFNRAEEKICYHSPCHQCRGLGVIEQPRKLIDMAARYALAEEEDTCCGFGGSYSIKFPDISEQIVKKKMEHFHASGASTLVTDCPGCVLQLRGAEQQQGGKLQVLHMAELITKQLK